MAAFDRVWRNARIATLAEGSEGLGVIERGAVACAAGRIGFVGPEAALPATGQTEMIDCEGRWITPGLIDSHTHLVHAGSRVQEWEQRLAGASYESIAHAGGGIAASVQAVRDTSLPQLVAQALPRLDALLAEGVTTIEIKSGYGLSLEGERKQLQAARALARVRPVSVRTTFLGAHAMPPGESGRDAYIARVCEDMLPPIAAEGLADAVDAFCETIAFSPDQIRMVFAAARRLGLPVKLHADQLSDGGGALLAAEAGALSADHLEYASEDGAAALARSRTVAVLLPGAFYTLGETHKPPVAAFRRHGVRMALATDCNPGSSPLTSILLAMNMGATLFRLSVHECIAGVTREGARALGVLDQAGTLEPGKWCDLALWSIAEPAELVYRLGFNPLHSRIWHGI